MKRSTLLTQTAISATLFGALRSPGRAAPAAAPPAPSPGLRPADIDACKSPLEVADGTLTGAGAAVLKQAVQGARYVLVGEDHGIAQIPAFCSALFRTVATAGFRTIAVEIGALIEPVLQQAATAPDGDAQVAAFDKRYPESIAFYNWREELAFLHASAAAVAPSTLEIWGVDQALMGSTGLILTRVIDTTPSANAKALAEQLLHDNDAARAAALLDGDPRKLLMMSGDETKFQALRDELRASGDPAGAALVDSLIESRTIYHYNGIGAFGESNGRRARLMKREFAVRNAAATRDGTPPKVFFKFGVEHMYKGICPEYTRELGNNIVERADADGTGFVNIFAAGLRGKQLRFMGVGRTPKPAALDLLGADSDFAFVAPLAERVYSDGWTLFDLRKLRTTAKFPKVDREMERLLLGFDFLLLIPAPAASEPIS